MDFSVNSRQDRTLESPIPGREFKLPDPNPMTTSIHKREVFWQISLPFFAGIIIFLVLVVLGWMATSQDASLWADVSLIFLIILLGFLFFFILALSSMLVYLFIVIHKQLPPYSRLVQDYADQARTNTRRVADRAVEPVMRTQGLRASIAALFDTLTGVFSRR